MGRERLLTAALRGLGPSRMPSCLGDRWYCCTLGTVFARVALGEQRDLRIIPSRISAKRKEKAKQVFALYAILVDTVSSLRRLYVSTVPNDKYNYLIDRVGPH